MARLARVVAVGEPHHLTQRGNNRQPTFFDDHDRNRYCRLLREQAARAGMRLLGYCLMTNHVHLVALPRVPGGRRNCRRFGFSGHKPR
jgi:putative transposase